MAAITQLGLSPTRNALKDEIHIDGDLSALKVFYPMADGTFDDSTIHGVRNAIMQTFDFEPTTTQVHEALLAMALMQEYHPVRDYLNSLKWDGVARLGSYFTEYCGTPNNAYTSKVGEILLKAAVARAMKPGTKFDTMVILEGIQGCGKSTLLKVLGGEWTLEGLPNRQDLNHKDVIQAIQGYWLIEVEELAVMRKSDVDSLKAFITRQTDKARFAYAKEAKTYQRQCVFVGTTNDDEYLLDSTGNRRFLPIEVGVIDLAGVAVVRDQLWAEAKVLWDANPTEASLALPQSMWEDAAEQQEDRRVQDPLEFKVREFLGSLEPGTDFISVPELLWGVLHKSGSDAEMKDTRRINRAFKTISEWRGSRRGKGSKRIRGYERSAT
jgi:predicted P-loop ATPase